MLPDERGDSEARAVVMAVDVAGVGLGAVAAGAGEQVILSDEHEAGVEVFRPDVLNVRRLRVLAVAAALRAGA